MFSEGDNLYLFPRGSQLIVPFLFFIDAAAPRALPEQIRLLGQWEELEGFPGKTVPVGGIAYYITPPASLANVFTDPFHTVFYLTFILMSCAMLSKAWMEVSGSSSQVPTKAARPRVPLRTHSGICF